MRDGGNPDLIFAQVTVQVVASVMEFHGQVSLDYLSLDLQSNCTADLGLAVTKRHIFLGLSGYHEA